MSNLRPIHRAYIAGIFDGEGSIYPRATNHGRDTTIPHGRPRVSIAQKNPEVLLWIQEKLGYGHLRVHTHATNVSVPSEQWRLDISRMDDVADFIQVVYRYSIVKRKRLAQAKRWLDNRTEWR